MLHGKIAGISRGNLGATQKACVQFFFRMTEKGGLGLRGVAFMPVSAVVESTLPSFCSSYKIQCQETTVTVLKVLVVEAVGAVSVVTATPLKLNPPLSSS